PPRRRQARRQRPSDFEGSWLRSTQHVAHASDVLDQVRRVELGELASQVTDVHAQRVGRRPEVIAPYALVDEAVRQDASRIQHQELEQLIFGARELDDLVTESGPVPVSVELEPVEAQMLAAELGARTSQKGSHSRGQLADIERLD